MDLPYWAHGGFQQGDLKSLGQVLSADATGTRLLVRGNAMIQVWDLKNAKIVATFGKDQSPLGALLRRDGHRAFIGLGGNRLVSWDFDRNRAEWEAPVSSPPSVLRSSADDGIVTLLSDHKVVIFSVKARKEVGEIKFRGEAFFCDVTQDGNYVILGTGLERTGWALDVWDWRKGESIRRKMISSRRPPPVALGVTSDIIWIRPAGRKKPPPSEDWTAPLVKWKWKEDRIYECEDGVNGLRLAPWDNKKVLVSFFDIFRVFDFSRKKVTQTAQSKRPQVGRSIRELLTLPGKGLALTLYTDSSVEVWSVGE